MLERNAHRRYAKKFHNTTKGPAIIFERISDNANISTPMKRIAFAMLTPTMVANTNRRY